jgi:hypothetical protein
MVTNKIQLVINYILFIGILGLPLFLYISALVKYNYSPPKDKHNIVIIMNSLYVSLTLISVLLHFSGIYEISNFIAVIAFIMYFLAIGFTGKFLSNSY